MLNRGGRVNRRKRRAPAGPPPCSSASSGSSDSSGSFSSGACSPEGPPSSSSGSSSSLKITLSSGSGTVKPGGRLLSRKAGAFKLGEAGQVADGIEAEMFEEGIGGAVGDGPARCAPAPAQTHPADFKKNVERALGSADATDFLDLRARNRLMIAR